jgi:hypothetical protein
MKFVLAAEDEGPRKAPDPMHVFLDAGQGNIWLFRAARPAPMDRDRNTGLGATLPGDSVATLVATKQRLEAAGIGCWARPITRSSVDLLFDPSGHRVELAANTGIGDERLDDVNGTCWRSGPRPARPSARPGCTTAAAAPGVEAIMLASNPEPRGGSFRQRGDRFVQNLPLGVFRRRGRTSLPRRGGDRRASSTW